MLYNYKLDFPKNPLNKKRAVAEACSPLTSCAISVTRSHKSSSDNITTPIILFWPKTSYEINVYPTYLIPLFYLYPLTYLRSPLKKYTVKAVSLSSINLSDKKGIKWKPKSYDDCTGQLCAGSFRMWSHGHSDQKRNLEVKPRWVKPEVAWV